jgi:hypothetical protein
MRRICRARAARANIADGSASLRGGRHWLRPQRINEPGAYGQEWPYGPIHPLAARHPAPRGIYRGCYFLDRAATFCRLLQFFPSETFSENVQSVGGVFYYPL